MPVSAPTPLFILLGLLAATPPSTVAAAPPPAAPQEASAAQEQGGDPSAAAPESARGVTDRAELEAFLAGLMEAHMEDHDVAGATVSVVKDGELYFSRGYGWADVEERAPVDPATTLFRIGSVSKLFTWTAVMQQVEAGTLDLDTDVNEYLDFRIPDTYPEPITLRHILTHTPGFEDRGFGLFSHTPELSRGEWLRQNVPARVRPPGTFSSYSNYATALAGYIVGRVTDTTWEAYVDERILEPLGMRYATARQPLPDDLAPHMSTSYAWEAGQWVEKPFEWIDGPAPAGSMSASAEAMAAFMIAHLQLGLYGDARILAEETARRMHERTFGHDPRLPGFGLGFYEKSSHGLRIIGHGGDTQWFHTDLALIPSEELGVFVSYNTDKGGEISFGPFLESFLDHFYPVEPFDPPTAPEDWEARADGYAGSYRFNRTSYTTFEKVANLMTAISVEPGEAGELLISSPLGTDRVHWVEPGHFRARDASLEVAFREDDGQEASHMFLSLAPMMAAEKLTFWQAPLFHQVILGLCVLLFASALLLHPVRFGLQKTVEGVKPLRGAERGFRWLALGVAALNVAFLVGLGTVAGDVEAIVQGEEGALKAVLTLGLLSLPPTVAVVWAAVQAWRKKLWGGWGRVHFTLFALAAVLFLAELHYWNLLGWRI